MKPRNIIEIIMSRELKRSQKLLDLSCECELCLADILAISLNQYPPKYIVNQDLEPYVRVKYDLMQDDRANILATITHAAKRVSENPRCERKKMN